MNTLPLRRPSETLQHAQCWALSLLLHGLAVGLAIALVADLQFASQPKSFRWDVALVDTPLPNPVDPQTPSESKAAAAPVPSPQPIVQARHTVPTVQRVVRQEVRAVMPVAQASMQATAQSPRQSAPIASRTVQSVDAPQQIVLAPTETLVTVDTQSVVRETQVVAETPPPLSEAGLSVVARPTVEARQASATVEKRAVVKEATVKTVPPAFEQAAAREVPVRSTPATRPDYRWLDEALLKSMNQWKGAPRPSEKGTVTLRIIIMGDDRAVDLLDLGVEQSSGHPVLDRYAMEHVRQTFPLRIEHPLGQSEVLVYLIVLPFNMHRNNGLGESQ